MSLIARLGRVGCFLLLWPAALPPAAGAGPAYVAGLPSAERVLREVRGVDDTDTAARRLAAFTVLRNAVETLAAPRLAQRALDPAEIARLRDWGDARRALEARLRAGFDPACVSAECPRWRFNRLRIAYEVSAAFKKDLWTRLTERAWRERHVPDWPTLAQAPPLAPLAVPTPGQMSAPREPPPAAARAALPDDAQQARREDCASRCEAHTCTFGLPAYASNIAEMNRRSQCEVMIRDCFNYCMLP